MALTKVNATNIIDGTLPTANGGTGVTTSTGSGNNVLSTSPTLVTPILGTPTSVNLSNATALPIGGITASGTPSSSNYLRGDGTWATVASSQWTTTGSDIYYNTGNVGVGTTAPATKLNVVESGTADAVIRVSNNNGGVYAASLNVDSTNLTGSRYNTIYSSNNNTYQWAISGGGADATMVFGTGSSNTERMRITSAGNLAVGASSAYADSRFTVQSASTTNGCQTVNIYNSAASSTTRNANTLVRICSQGSGADSTIVLTDNTSYNVYFCGNQGQASVTANSGGVYLGSGATSWAGISDARLKNVTGTYTTALADIAQLEPVKFTWKSDENNTPQVGLIAQSVQKVIPEAVEAQKSDGNIEYLGVRYTEVIPLLVAAIKELKAEFDAYKAKHP